MQQKPSNALETEEEAGWQATCCELKHLSFAGGFYAITSGSVFLASVHRSRLRPKRAGHSGILSVRLRTVYPDDHNSAFDVCNCFPKPDRGDQRHRRISCWRHQFNAFRGLRQYRRGLHRAGLVFRWADAADIAAGCGIADITRITQNERPRASERDAAHGSLGRSDESTTSARAGVDLLQQSRNCGRGSSGEYGHEDLFEPGCHPARTAEWAREVRRQDRENPVKWSSSGWDQRQ